LAKYNRTFDLSVEDMDLIESALRTAAREPEAGVCAREANDLLGRLHNQKVFYRPKSEGYVSG
jgi:hypothetical protein